MRTLAPGRNSPGFTLIELLLVIAIIAVASAGVSFAMRDSAESQLEQEAVRLAALLESGRARSQASGVPVVWRTTDTGFEFRGLPEGALPKAWLSTMVAPSAPTVLVLGPDPITGPQKVRLVTQGSNRRTLEVATDGVRPYGVQVPAAAGPP